MTYKGHVKNGVVVFDGPVPVEEGAEVRIHFVRTTTVTSEKSRPTIAQRLESVTGKAEGFPADWSENHDAYLRDMHNR